MEDAQADEEKKPFDAEHTTGEDDAQPDPDEPLMMDAGNGRVWLVKIPRFLMQRWSKIDAEGVHLATVRVYHDDKAVSGKKPRIVLYLPNPDNPSTIEGGDEYEMDMINDQVENQIVIAEREKEPGSGSRARTTILTGRVKHECNLRPLLSEKYRQRLKERSKASNTPARSIRMIEDETPGGRGHINRLTSGVSNTGGFSDLVKPKPKAAKGQFERMARMPRNQLLDILFSSFREKDHWSIRPLRERTQQPEVYLKEVLSEIAFLHRSGEHNGTWELMPNFKADGIKGENVPITNLTPSQDVKMEDEDDEDDDDDDDDDMEEIS